MAKFCLFYILFFWFTFCSWPSGTAGREQGRITGIILNCSGKSGGFITYREQLGMFAVFANLFGNILIFVPYGFFISMAAERRGFFKTLFCSFGLSLCVELVQLVTRVGSFDVDDILLNTIGGILGYILFAICNGIRRRYHVRREKRR